MGWKVSIQYLTVDIKDFVITLRLRTLVALVPSVTLLVWWCYEQTNMDMGAGGGAELLVGV